MATNNNLLHLSRKTILLPTAHCCIHKNTPPPSTPEVRLDTMDELEKHLVHSGKYAELSDLLREKLEACGWYDDVLAVASRRLSVAEDPRSNSKEVLEAQNKAMQMIPENIKVEMLQIISSLLEGLVEKA